MKASERLSHYDFDLPKERIADRPVSPRDAARLLAVGEEFLDHTMRDLSALLAPGDLLVFNDTRVLPARLFGHRDQAKIEVTLHKALAADRWLAFARPGKKLGVGNRLCFAEGLEAEVLEKREGGEIALQLNQGGEALSATLERIGRVPLPPYIRRDEGPDAKDREDYQTIFAATPGAVAAPTAGLHYTERLLRALEARGIGRVMLTLHVGAGTFLPVTTENLAEHRLHSEWGQISKNAARTINEARAKGGRIVPVGTTALRLLETAADANGLVQPFEGETSLFIKPGHAFRAADLLLTNFHLPRSTLFVLVCAFAGRTRMLEAYAHAIRTGYRFYSYGDCCLLTPEAKE
ncbi:MAG: tRNA preQ1(34) S-adenosylmethionine ribosyltransferase-isomerase QueA [Alphaproteobacteria bacterium]|nr:tRNA preQ1(34) S-adenosylmethionine ribosyltransferase-isomerase QueA [Alphaproteobacteria bacterium]